MEKLMKAKDIADWFDMDVQRVYELTRRDLLPHIQVADRQYRYSPSAIQRWINEGGTTKEVKNNVAN